jgi:hypothetical protein
MNNEHHELILIDFKETSNTNTQGRKHISKLVEQVFDPMGDESSPKCHQTVIVPVTREATEQR